MEQQGVKPMGRAEKGVEGGSKGREGTGIAISRGARSWKLEAGDGWQRKRSALDTR